MAAHFFPPYPNCESDVLETERLPFTRRYEPLPQPASPMLKKVRHLHLPALFPREYRHLWGVLCWAILSENVIDCKLANSKPIWRTNNSISEDFRFDSKTFRF